MSPADGAVKWQGERENVCREVDVVVAINLEFVGINVVVLNKIPCSGCHYYDRKWMEHE